MMWDILPDMAWKSVVTLCVTLTLLQLLKCRSAAQRAWVAHIGLGATLLLRVGGSMTVRVVKDGPARMVVTGPER